MNAIKYPDVIMNQRGMYFKENNDNYINFKDVILILDRSGNCESIKFENKY